MKRLLVVLWLAAGPGCYPDADELRARASLDGTRDGASGTRAEGGRGGGAPPSGSGGSGGSGGTSGAGATDGGAAGAGASGSDGPAGGADAGGGNPQTVAEACTAYADANVAALARCSQLFLQLLYGTRAVAEQRMRLLCRYAELPGSNFPPRPVQPCLAALRAQPCGDFFDGLIPAACQAAGDFPSGSRCIDGGQCQSGFCDLGAAVGGCGRCAPAPAAGDACAQGRLCAPGLLCTASQTCVTPADLGGACSDTAPCRESLSCQGGACGRRGGRGAACSDQVDCDLAGGSACNPLTRICIPFRVGASCGLAPDGALVACPAAGTCDEGTCTPAAADGARCDDDGGPSCMLPALCIAGTCQMPPHDPSCRP